MKPENKELNQTKLKAEEEIRILRTITRTISYNLDLEEVLKQIVGIVTQFMKGDSCLLYLVDERKEELVLMASRNPHPKIMGKIRLRLGEGITGWVAKRKKQWPYRKTQVMTCVSSFFMTFPKTITSRFFQFPLSHGMNHRCNQCPAQTGTQTHL